MLAISEHMLPSQNYFKLKKLTFSLWLVAAVFDRFLLIVMRLWCVYCGVLTFSQFFLINSLVKCIEIVFAKTKVYILDIIKFIIGYWVSLAMWCRGVVQMWICDILRCAVMVVVKSKSYFLNCCNRAIVGTITLLREYVLIFPVKKSINKNKQNCICTLFFVKKCR